MTTTSCDNPRCTCRPCTCDDCGCGVASLGELERRVMNILWESPGHAFSARDVAGALPEYAYTTVATVLDRVLQKGLVRRSLDGRTNRFVATAGSADYAADAMREAMVMAPHPDAVLARFVEVLDGPQAEALRTALAQRETTA